jgi:hypothetical protein
LFKTTQGQPSSPGVHRAPSLSKHASGELTLLPMVPTDHAPAMLLHLTMP